MIKEYEDNIIKLGLLFYITSIFGFFYEWLLTIINTNKLYHHGFLHGPWLPIYGIGALLIMSIYKYRNKPIIIFLGSMIISGIVEYISGFLLLKIFKMRLWNYTGWFLNINGFICFLSVLCFGMGGLLITYYIYPLVKRLFLLVKKTTLKKFLIIISALFCVDIIASLLK